MKRKEPPANDLTANDLTAKKPRAVQTFDDDKKPPATPPDQAFEDMEPFQKAVVFRLWEIVKELAELPPDVNGLNLGGSQTRGLLSEVVDRTPENIRDDANKTMAKILEGSPVDIVTNLVLLSVHLGTYHESRGH
tara:strand:- start:399 stop:803 length:405 start_codon:yes stop_codon:yes gene_type:complete